MYKKKNQKAQGVGGKSWKRVVHSEIKNSRSNAQKRRRLRSYCPEEVGAGT
jgi:hypothetical protein